MRVAIVGTGYVGLVAGACLAELGHDVVCVDVVPERVDAINDGRAPIHEDGLPELLARHVPDRLRATTDLAAAVAASELTMIAVGTPFGEGRIDLSAIEAATRQVGAALREVEGDHVVVVKSTVVPGTTADVVTPLLAASSGRTPGDGLGVAMNPEFLREGRAVHDFMHPDRIVLGSDHELALDRLEELYAPLRSPDVLRTSATTAELVKYASNGLLATLISFSNDIANLAAELDGVDVVEVMRGVHLDGRLSPVVDGVRVVPGITTYLEAGAGFGGSCFPKDVRALVSHGEQRGVPMHVLGAVLRTNADQPARVVGLVRDGLDGLDGRRVTVLGIAFKEGTDDVRESASLPVVDGLLGEGAVVTAHDPAALDAVAERWGDRVRLEPDLATAVADADAVVLMTRWPDYLDLSRVLGEGDALVVDGRRMLDPTSVGRYAGIGRGT